MTDGADRSLNIAYVAAGAAGMYCGSCLHDNTLAAALTRRGHEVTLIPTYTPLRTDETDTSIDQVFFGAINVYLQQKSALFRHTPRFLDRLLDRKGLLDQVGRFAASTDAHELGALTLSVLQGRDGRQAKELDRLVEFLATLEPDVVQLTNALLLGFAGPIRDRLGVPVVCGLTGEDVFLDELDPPWHDRVLETMRAKARDAAAFIATSQYYADEMTRLLDVPAERMHVVPLGISLADIEPPGPPAAPDPQPESLRIGYLARISPEKGLHVLVEAFHHLVHELDGQPGVPRLELAAAGWVGPRAQAYLHGLEAQIAEHGLEDRVTILGEVDREEKLRFLRSLDVLSVPSPYREPKGLYVLEALAHGVPVVQPNHGAFPELLEATGGGLLVTPDEPRAFAEGLAQLVRDPARRLALGRQGRGAVVERFDDERMAGGTVGVYGGVVGTVRR